MTDPASLPPLLLPRPRLVEPGRGPASGTMDAEVINRGVRLKCDGNEAYMLRLGERGVTIAARTDAGAAHAHRTLAQLRNQYGEKLPVLEVHDAPAFPTRGVMLDISRDRVPTMEHLLETVNLLASLKFNHLQLYTEHTFAYRGHEEVWRDASPMTPDEVRTLDAHCRARGVELAANQNCFGHLAKWLTLPRYAPLAETHGDWVFEFREERFPRRGPFSVCPTDPASLALVEDLLGQLLPCFSSALVNIGCDETFDVGFGRSRGDVERRGREAVYAEFVAKIAGAARRHGKRSMFWADIALTKPECLADLPGDLIGLAWGYEPDSPWTEWCRALGGTGVPPVRREFWVCPGTSSWRSITGRTTERRANLAGAAREGLASGATGYLVTDWGDSGHHQQWPVSLVALAEAADAAWTGGRDGYDPRAASLHAFGDRTLQIAPLLDQLGDADLPMRERGGRVGPGEPPARLRNSSVLFCDLHMPTHPPAGLGDDDRLRRGLDSLPVSMWEEAAGRLHALASGAARWKGAGAAALADPRMSPELSHTLDVACFAAIRGLWRRMGKFGTKDRQGLARWLGTIIEKHRELWRARSREGGLASSTAHYKKVLADLEAE